MREKVERSFDEALADRGDATLSSRESVESRMPRQPSQPCFGWNDLRMNKSLRVVFVLCLFCLVLRMFVVSYFWLSVFGDELE